MLICFLWLRKQHYSLRTCKENKFMLAHGSVQGQGATSGGSCLAGSVLRPCEHHVAKSGLSQCLCETHGTEFVVGEEGVESSNSFFL